MIFERFSKLLTKCKHTYQVVDEQIATDTIRFYKFIPRKKRGESTIVSLHGTGNDALYPHLQLFLHWLELGFEVMAFDLPGHGRHSTSFFDHNNNHKLIQRCLEKIYSSHENRSLHYIGYSLGGAELLNLHFRQNTIPKPDSIHIVATPISPWKISWRAANELSTFFKPKVLGTLKIYGAYGLLPSLKHFKRNEYPVRLKNPGTDYLVSAVEYFRFLDLSSLRSDMLQEDSTKLFLYYGTKDHIAPHQDGIKLAEALGGKLISVPKANHMSILFKPEIFEF